MIDTKFNEQENYTELKKLYTILIIYKTETGNGFIKKIITGVSNYGLYDITRCFYITKNGYNSFIPAEHVIFLGLEEDYI